MPPVTRRAIGRPRTSTFQHPSLPAMSPQTAFQATPSSNMKRVTERKRAQQQSSTSQPLIQQPTTQSKVTREHSLQIMRVAITSTISIIAQLKRLFGYGYKFHYRIYDTLAHDFDFNKSFREGDLATIGFTDLKAGEVTCPIIAGGQSTEADKVLRWLDGGVTEAIEKDALRGLEMNFHDAAGGQELSELNIIETFILTFSSDEEIKTIIRKDGQEESATVTMSNAITELRELMNRVQKRLSDHNARDMKRGTHATMRLWLDTKKIPERWEPTGFDSSNSRPLNTNSLIPEIGLSMVTGFHRVSLLMPEDCIIAKQQSQNPQMTGNSALQSNIDISDSASSKTGTPMSGTRIPPSDDDIHTQADAMANLGRMGYSRVSQVEGLDTQLLSHERVLDRDSWPVNQQESSLIPLTPVASKTMASPTRQQLSLNGIKDDVYPTSHPTDCECQADNNELETMLCMVCKHNKHLFCYGYEVAPSEEDRVCYTCILGKTRLSSMQKLCAKRRLLYYLNTAKTIPQLVPYFGGRSELEIYDIIKQLQQLGYLREIKAPGRRNVGKLYQPKAKFIAVAGVADKLCSDVSLQNDNILEETRRGAVDSALVDTPSHLGYCSSTQGTPSTSVGSERRTSIIDGRKRNAGALSESESRKAMKISVVHSPLVYARFP